MGHMTLLVAFLLAHLPTELISIQVVVPETERSVMLFGAIIVRCDYSTSGNPQEVLVSWKFKSFCKDPVLEYYSTAYQAALQLGQDPANDCPDDQRTVRTVIQKRGINEPMLGAEYRNRKITIQNKADLVINEVMWWDNGMYYCTIDAPGDTTGDSDREVKLIVYHWLTVLLIIIGFLLLIMLFCICCCQCCPQKCCCYVRCPCCPQTCCCPEKAVMQHRMMKEAQKAMAPWMHGQPVYAPIYSDGSVQGVPLLYSGSASDYPTKQSYPMAPMQMAPLGLQQPPPPHPQYAGNNSLRSSIQAKNPMLDYLENQVRGLDVGIPPYSAQTMQPLQPQPSPQVVPYTPGPPSMLSALDEMGVQGVERRVITLPPIVQRVPSFSSRRGAAAAEDGARGYHRMSSQSSGSTSRSGAGPRVRSGSPPRQRLRRDYSDDSDWENRRGRAPERRGRGSRPRARSRDDLMEEVLRKVPRRERSYSPPPRGEGSWSSDENANGRRKGNGAKGWPEKPPSYYSLSHQPGRSKGRRNDDHLSDRGSHSSTSVVI